MFIFYQAVYSKPPNYQVKAFTVDYTSVLNSNANVGSTGNLNTSNIKYSNNPETADGHEEGETPDDTVKVFTFKPVIDKVDAQSNALAGAAFTIYKEIATGTEAQLGSAIKAANDAAIEDSALKDAKYYQACAMTEVGSSQTQFEFKGLADGTYVLVETTIPTGYNAFKSVEFTISSTVNATTPELLTLTGTTPFTNTNVGTGTVEVNKKDGTKHSVADGELYAEIENNSGTTLPSTGGIGTTIFYVVGAVLVLGAAAVILARRKAEQQ